MASRSSIIGARELKTRLGQYLNRVRKGETLLITDRDEPVAELRPIPGSANPLVASLKKLAADGAVTLPQKQNLSEFTAIRSRAGTASGAVAQDRDGRG